MTRVRLVFMGTSDLACPSLKQLTADRFSFKVEAVVTQPDRPRGRRLEMRPSPVKSLALQLGLSVWQPQRARDPSFLEALRQLNPDLIVVVAYGQLLPADLLDLPVHGCLNVHASLLPQYRGAAPIQWAILNGETQTGVTIMKMDEGLDTGDMLAWEILPIHDTDTAQTLHDRLAETGARLLASTIPEYVEGRLPPKPQPPGDSFYARKITKEDGQIDWQQPARSIWLKVRAFTPWPGAWTYFPANKNPLLKILEAQAEAAGHGEPGTILEAGADGLLVATGQGALRITLLQREGGRPLPVTDFLRGTPLHVGQHLGNPSPG